LKIINSEFTILSEVYSHILHADLHLIIKHCHSPKHTVTTKQKCNQYVKKKKYRVKLHQTSEAEVHLNNI
jgi:hypothetical protein